MNEETSNQSDVSVKWRQNSYKRKILTQTNDCTNAAEIKKKERNKKTEKMIPQNTVFIIKSKVQFLWSLCVEWWHQSLFFVLWREQFQSSQLIMQIQIVKSVSEFNVWCPPPKNNIQYLGMLPKMHGTLQCPPPTTTTKTLPYGTDKKKTKKMDSARYHIRN